MSTSRIQSGMPASALQIEEARTRTTPKVETRTFGSVMRSGAGIVLRGVEVGATVLGGPILGAAVRGVSAGVGVAGVGAGPLGGGIGGIGGVGGVGGDGGEQSTIDQMHAMQEQSQAFNMQYLSLQEEVQQENRRFTTVSNVLKAKHETAKSAIGNIRS